MMKLCQLGTTQPVYELSTYCSRDAKRRHKIADYEKVMLSTVDINVTEFLVSVTEKDRGGIVVKSWTGNMGMPTHALPTEATLLRLRKPLWDELSEKLGATVARMALQSCERLLWGLFPAVSGPCDKQDFSSASEIGNDGTASIYLYDMVYDGVGLTTVAYERMTELIDKAIERLDQCACDSDEGCFRCVANPLSNEATSKQATHDMLTQLRNEMTGRFTLIENEAEASFDDTPTARACSVCGASLKVADRFCSNCGEKQLM